MWYGWYESGGVGGGDGGDGRGGDGSGGGAEGGVGGDHTSFMHFCRDSRFVALCRALLRFALLWGDFEPKKGWRGYRNILKYESAVWVV